MHTGTNLKHYLAYTALHITCDLLSFTGSLKQNIGIFIIIFSTFKKALY